MKNKLKGFTLAEVLITLLIIRIVASLVIPTVINDAQKQEWVTGLQKGLSDFNQAYKMWQIDNGTTDFANNIPANMDGFLNEFVKYLDIVKVCPMNQKPGECFFQNVKYMNGNLTTNYFGNVGGHPNVDGSPRAILKNGNLILLYNYSRSCVWKKNVTNGVPDACTQIIIDVNGFKGPNVIGRDIFALVFTRKNGIIPTGIQWSDAYNGCTGSGYDEGCAGKIAREGWKMNY